MIKSAYDTKNNIVVLEFSGTVDVPQMEKLLADIRGVVPKEKNFRVLTDLSGTQSTDPAIREHIKRLMDYFNLSGVTEVIRVISDPSQDLGVNIMSAFHYSKDVRFRTFQTREEAQANL